VRHVVEHLAARDRETRAEVGKWDTPEGKVMP